MDQSPPAQKKAPCLLALGHERRYAGDLAGAEGLFRAAVAATPLDAEAFDALAEVLAETGRPGDAVTALRQADALDPGRPYRLAALARSLSQAGEATAGAEVCRRWLALTPGAVAALLTLADCERQLGHHDAAIAALREAVLLDSGQADAAATLAGLLTQTGDPLQALEVVQPTLRRRPDHAGLHYRLGEAWRALGEVAKAEDAWRRCLALDPDTTLDAATALAGLAPTPDGLGNTAPDTTYVRALFDRYAERFDADLLGKLAYRAPELLLDAIRALPESDETLDILDLGCGTGLAGAAFAPLARVLAGCDLAPRMIAEARKRAVYHQLEAGDLMTVLARESGRWDLILAADVFTYLGDLGPVLAASAVALRPGGRIAATVEESRDPAGVEIMPSRRVRHTESHLRAAAAAAGLTPLSLTRAPLRTETREPVIGLVFVLERR